MIPNTTPAVNAVHSGSFLSFLQGNPADFLLLWKSLRSKDVGCDVVFEKCRIQSASFSLEAAIQGYSCPGPALKPIPGLLIRTYFGAAGVTDQKQKQRFSLSGSASKTLKLHPMALVWRRSTWNRSSCESKLKSPARADLFGPPTQSRSDLL